MVRSRNLVAKCGGGGLTIQIGANSKLTVMLLAVGWMEAIMTDP